MSSVIINDTTSEFEFQSSKRKSTRKSLSPDWEMVFSGISLTKSYEAITELKEKEEVEFPTESTYKGQWDKLGMAGRGKYIMPGNVVYSGEMYDGNFDGRGTLTYPNGVEIDGLWHMGELLEFSFLFTDELDFEANSWQYCQMPDRRFYSSIEKGLRPAGRSRKTAVSPTRDIPKGCYDTGDGFFNPNIKCVINAEEPYEIIRIPTEMEETWIVNNCRKQWDEPTGYRPDLYEKWMSGRNSEVIFPEEEEEEVEAVVSTIPSSRSFHLTKKLHESAVHFE